MGDLRAHETGWLPASSLSNGLLVALSNRVEESLQRRLEMISVKVLCIVGALLCHF